MRKSLAPLAIAAGAISLSACDALTAPASDSPDSAPDMDSMRAMRLSQGRRRTAEVTTARDDGAAATDRGLQRRSGRGDARLHLPERAGPEAAAAFVGPNALVEMLQLPEAQEAF